MNKWIVGIIVLLLIVIAGGYLLVRPTMAPSPTTQPTGVQPTSAATQNTVMLTATGYSPAVLTIKAGTTVTWVNKSSEEATVNSNPHPTHTDYPPLNLGSFADGASLTLTFPQAGTYGYHNHLNPSEKGTIIVQ